MFISEQKYRGNIENQHEKGFSKSGMTFDKPTHVRLRFRYKQITIAFGVVIALIAIFLLWVSQSPSLGMSTITLPDFELPLAEEIVKTVLINITL